MVRAAPREVDQLDFSHFEFDDVLLSFALVSIGYLDGNSVVGVLDAATTNLAKLVIM